MIIYIYIYIYSDGKKFRNGQITQRDCIFWKNVIYESFMIFPYLSNGDINFDLDYYFEGHFKVKFNFSSGNHYFLPRIWKERTILRSGHDLLNQSQGHFKVNVRKF